MRFFGWGRKSRKPKKLPALLKCVYCQRRPCEVYHYRLPLCKACADGLIRHIRTDGAAIVKALESLKRANSTAEKDAFVAQIIDHAGTLVRYQDQRLKTIRPEPSEVIRLVNANDYQALTIQFCLDDVNP